MRYNWYFSKDSQIVLCLKSTLHDILKTVLHNRKKEGKSERFCTEEWQSVLTFPIHKIAAIQSIGWLQKVWKFQISNISSNKATSEVCLSSVKNKDTKIYGGTVHWRINTDQGKLVITQFFKRIIVWSNTGQFLLCIQRFTLD